MVDVLCVARNSIYHSLDCDAWDINRDVWTYTGTNPVVCHPPCRAWSAFCRHQAKPLPGEKQLALFCIDRLKANGGILEHPAYSTLFDGRLPLPGESAGDLHTVVVSQSWWGDSRAKWTWLCFSKIPRCGYSLPRQTGPPAGSRGSWNRMSKGKRQATPPAMAQWLIDAAGVAANYQ